MSPNAREIVRDIVIERSGREKRFLYKGEVIIQTTNTLDPNDVVRLVRDAAERVVARGMNGSTEK